MYSRLFEYIRIHPNTYIQEVTMRTQLNWAVLGTGVIANQMAQALQKMGKSLYAVGNRTYEKAVDFAKK